jgi:hypothetical protein
MLIAAGPAADLEEPASAQAPVPTGSSGAAVPTYSPSPEDEYESHAKAS